MLNCLKSTLFVMSNVHFRDVEQQVKNLRSTDISKLSQAAIWLSMTHEVTQDLIHEALMALDKRVIAHVLYLDSFTVSVTSNIDNSCKLSIEHEYRLAAHELDSVITKITNFINNKDKR